MREISLSLIKKIFDYFSTDWNEALRIEEQDIDYSFDIFLNKINQLLDNFAPFKKTSQYKLKYKSKPWITSGLLKPNSVKNPTVKAKLHLKYKSHKT